MLLLATAAHIAQFRSEKEVDAMRAYEACVAAGVADKVCPVPPLPRVLFVEDPWSPLLIGAFTVLFHLPRVIVRGGGGEGTAPVWRPSTLAPPLSPTHTGGGPARVSQPALGGPRRLHVQGEACGGGAEGGFTSKAKSH